MSLHTLLDDPEGARRMGEEGTRWVTGRFSSRRLADDVTGLYRELLDRKAPRRKRARQPAKHPGRVRTESAFAIR
jgi:hypothetical protein